MQPVVVKAFPGATEALAAERFAADVVVATRLGYAVASRTWDGTSLTVVYELREPRAEGLSGQAPGELAGSNAIANRERAEANAKANAQRALTNEQATRERAAANTRVG